MKKYALLDTDFISKTHFISNNMGRSLLDLITELPGYRFFCHKQIFEELNYHNQPAVNWLRCKIEEQKIECYTDEKILNELSEFYGDFSCITYTQILKEACDAFSRSYFRMHYQTLENFDFSKYTEQKFLETLQKADQNAGKHNNLGEIKTYVLLQLLSLLKGEQIYVFCSDDKEARNGAANFYNVRCISILSAFLRLKKEIFWTLADAKPYIDSYVQFCAEHNQQTFRVMEASAIARIQKISCRQALEEIFEDHFIELKNGFLKYRDS